MRVGSSRRKQFGDNVAFDRGEAPQANFEPMAYRDEPANSLHIELHVPDFAPVRQFYGHLGFEVARETSGPGHQGYLVMKRNEVVLCFWPGDASYQTQRYFQQFPADTPRGYGVELVIAISDLDDAYERAQELGAVVGAMTTKPWGLRDFRIADPYGYYLRFTEPHDIVSHGLA